MSAEGEVEKKVRLLGEEIFEKYNPGGKDKDDDDKPVIKKEHLREFIMTIMQAAGEDEAWDETDFDDGYNQYDKDRGGTIDMQEFTDFIKKYADL